MMSGDVVTLRLFVSALLTGLIGYERERSGRAAGFRTHILVGVGSCLVMMTDLYLVDIFAGRTNVDPARMAAQVISGIGFLGAGTIIQSGASVRGLTTAASIWAVAGVGLAVGTGFYGGAVVATMLLILILVGLRGFERGIRKDSYRVLIVECRASGESLARLRQTIAAHGGQVQHLSINRVEGQERAAVEMTLRLSAGRDQHSEDQLLGAVAELPGTHRALWA